MRAITAVGATPNRVKILYDFLVAAGPEGLDRERLKALVTPSTLAEDPEAGTDNALADALNAGEDLGMFAFDAGKVRALAEGGSTFLVALEARAIDSPASVMESSGWIAGAICWLLCQDPRERLAFGLSAARNRLQSDMGPAGPVFGMTNDSRWHQAVYWARALGYVDRMPIPEEVVIADPTRALERRLARLLPPDVRKPLPTVLADLARDCPVLDGGRLRREVEAAASVRRDESTVSLSLALALVRLKRRGALAFESLSDGQAVMVEGLLGGRATHVTRRTV